MRRNIKQGVAAIRQRMLILHYQRLYLFSLFYSGRSDHPLLAIYPSGTVSKPLHPHVLFYYTIFFRYFQPVAMTSAISVIPFLLFISFVKIICKKLPSYYIF